MISTRCEYIIYPKKKEYSDEDYIVGKFKTSADNIPAKYRENGKRSITFTAKGKGIPTSKKFDVLLEGKWNVSEKYGLELFVQKADIAPPFDEKGIVDYLSTFLEGCGPRTAQKIYKRFGQATLMILDSEPHRFLEVKGIRKKQLERMLSSYEFTRRYKELSKLLSPFGISKKQIELIYARLGANSVNLIRENPFILDKYRGFSFDLLDNMSQRFECNPAETTRVESAIKMVLRLAMTGSPRLYPYEHLATGGHLYINQYELRELALHLLNVRTDSKVERKDVTEALWRMYNHNHLLGSEGNVYLPDNFCHEQKTARYIVDMLVYSNVKRYPDDEVFEAIDKAENEFDIKLSNNQREAVAMVLQNPLSIITGGAGTGKTTVLKVVLSCLKQLGENLDDVMLAAPTGKAAIRMTESTSYPASTIHKALGLISDEDFFKGETEIDTITSPFVVCDEYSMSDMFLAFRLFAAVDRCNSRVLLCGDVGQLPSVGAGKVLNELIDSGIVPVTKLNVIFRQAQESNIVRNSHNINKGVKFVVFEKDFLYTECRDSQKAVSIIVEKYIESVKQFGLDETVILSPVKTKGVLSVSSLNSEIQAVINPPSEVLAEHSFHGVLYRENDRVMQLKNREAKTLNYESVTVCNGDVGTIKNIHKSDDEFYCVIEFSSNRVIEYDNDDMNQVTLAYAMTIHKSQGSEFASVILPMHSYFPQKMISRNLLYTAVTRAKKFLNIVGDKNCIYRAIDNSVPNNRNTNLSEKIKEYFNLER